MKPVYVTKPYLPPLEEFVPYLRRIWESGVITNLGPMHNELETQLEAYLGVNNVSLVNNGTVGLLIAIKALELTGEVITTPFSFTATPHSLLWNNLTPVFADIDSDSMNISVNSIEPLITEKTSAIMPVHVYGRPCDVDAIQKLADRYKLKVIYDAAHAFGTKCHCGSVLSHGDASVISFHATKVFNTFEGGAIVARTPELKKKINSLRNFGIVDEVTVSDCGTNGKMSEINAAMGLLQLQHVDAVIAERQQIAKKYLKELEKIPGLQCAIYDEPSLANYSYFPIVVDPAAGVTRDQIYDVLKNNNIYSRKYFYPLLSNLPMYSGSRAVVPMANLISSRVLCLPIYPGLTDAELCRISNLIRGLYE